MPSHVVSSLLHAAPGALSTYRKNKVLDRMRKGNKHVFQAVELMTSANELLEDDVKDAFSLSFRECDELRCIIEDASEYFGATGMNDISEQYVASAQELLDYAKVHVTRARAQGLTKAATRPPKTIPPSLFPSGASSSETLIAALGARPATPALSISSASTSSSAGDSPPSSPTTHVDSTSKPTFHTPPKPSGTGGLFFASKDNSYRAYEVTTLPTLLDVKTTTAPAHNPTASGYRAYEVTTQNHGEITSTSPPSNSGRHDDNLPAISVTKPRMTTSREAPDRPESPDLGVVPDVARALRKSYRLTSRYRCQSSCTPHKQCPPLSRSTSAVSAQSAPERLESNKTDPPPVAANTQTLTAQPSPTSTNKRPKVPAPLPLGAAHATRPSGASAPGTRAQSSVDPDAQLPPTPTLRQQFRSEGFAMRRPPTASRAGVETAWF